MKICKTCKRKLPKAEFPLNGMQNRKEIRRPECRTCYNFRMKNYMRLWRDAFDAGLLFRS